MENEKEQKEEPKIEKTEFQNFLIDDDVYKTLLSKKFLSRKKYEIKDPGKVVSFIPGTIIKVFVKEGQKIKTGEKLLVLEAMKMQNILLAPINGKIFKIHTTTGNKVANKQLLVEIK